METQAHHTAPGRLGNPDMTLATDPRADARLLAGMEPFGMAELAPSPPVDVNAPYADMIKAIGEVESGMSGLFTEMYASLPEITDVERTVETIEGADGNRITLYVHRPTTSTGPLPAILHLHGGGMAMLAAADDQFTRWRDELSTAGAVVVGVEFRNSAGALGPHPFPGGLNDCMAALVWLHEHRRELGVSAIVVSGESGGGNLTLATALRAKREGLLDAIDGVYAQCPYISGSYASPPPELMSLRENDGYFIEHGLMSLNAAVYDPTGQHANDPLAWPYHATRDDLADLPPHVITVNELDPLRDEGLAYHHNLVAAGVSSVCRTINGTSHAAEVIFCHALADVYAAAVRDLVGFARSVRRD
jgi:acetyl esterase/lipase